MENRSQYGIPAIEPHLSTIPAFTEEDVRAYVTTHPIASPSISSAEPPTVLSVKFITAQEASGLIHNFVSWRKDDLVCYVELEGDFLFHGGPPGYIAKTTPTRNRIFEILDAQTGNCFITGFLPRKTDG